MADQITLTRSASTSQYAPHPEGQYAARCVDVIDLGERVEEFPGSPTKVVRKLALVFASGERIEAARRAADVRAGRHG